MKTRALQFLALAAAAALLASCSRVDKAAAPGAPATSTKTVLRVGHFPNITHAQAVIAHGLSRAGKGWFEERLGPDVEVQWFIYNAGPSAMEAIFARSLDLSYVGPNPAVNAHLKSSGDEIRVVAGACSGGAALVIADGANIKTAADFKDKRIGTPQLGNTQDVAARAWLRGHGHRVTITGGDLRVLPVPNPDQLTMFQRGTLDAAWTVEPWVSRLELEAKGKIFLEEKSLWPQTGGKYVTTHLVSSVKFLKTQPELLKKWIAAQVELTAWIQAHPAEAQQILNAELKAETKRALAPAVLERAWSRLELTSDPIRDSLLHTAEAAHEIGFIRQPPELGRLYDLRILNQVLAEKNLPPIR